MRRIAHLVAAMVISFTGVEVAAMPAAHALAGVGPGRGGLASGGTGPGRTGIGAGTGPANLPLPEVEEEED